MAFDTLSHAPVFVWQSLQVFNLPMTFPASNFAVDVALMIEQYMLCHVIHFYPGCWRLRIEVAVLNLDPWMAGNNIFMAVQTFFNRRYSWMIGIRHIRVTVLALDLFDPAVNIMAERDRLFRSNGSLRQIEKKENKHRNSQPGD
jgi:hypothetical protein